VEQINTHDTLSKCWQCSKVSSRQLVPTFNNYFSKELATCTTITVWLKEFMCMPSGGATSSTKFKEIRNQKKQAKNYLVTK